MDILSNVVNIEEKHGCTIGLLANDFSTNKNYFEYKQNEHRVAASSIKLFIASAVVETLEKKNIGLDVKIPIKSKHFVEGNSILADMDVAQLSVHNLLYLLLAHSDTSAQNTLEQIITAVEVNDYILDTDFQNTFFESNYSSKKTNLSFTSPSDTVTYMRKLWNKELHSQSDTKLLLSFLQCSRITHFGLRNLPTSFNTKHPIVTKRYSKAGRIYNSINDTFVVETKNGTLGVGVFIDNYFVKDKFNSVDHEGIFLLSSIAESIFNEWHSLKNQ